MEARLEFGGNGGDLFKKLIVGAILTGITFGIYMPWFIVAFQKYIYENTQLRRTARGDVKLSFQGTGGDLFVTLLVGYLLSAVTLGIYLPWFIVKLNKFFTDNTVGHAPDGAEYRLQTEVTGGELFKTMIVGYLLSIVTLGVYLPWMIVNIQKCFLDNTKILENGQAIGTCAFAGKGGDLFVAMLVGYLLSIVTLGIYFAWFQVNMFKFMIGNTQVRIRGRLYQGEFTGTGGEYFVTLLVGYLLTMITFGIYGFWFMAKLIKFQFDNTTYKAAQQQQLADPAPRVAIPARA